MTNFRGVARTVTVALYLPACAGDMGDPPCRSLGGGRELCGGTSTVVPITSGDGSALIDARVDAKAVRLLVDTGAEMSVLSPSLVGGADRTLVQVDLCVGELCLKNETVYLWETPFSSATGDHAHGFIGMRTLKDFSVDFDRGASVGFALGSSPCSGPSVPMIFTEYGRPTVGVSLGSQPPTDVAVDTGSSYTLLGQASFDAHSADISGSTPASVCTVNGCTDGAAFTAGIASYCVGPVCESAVPIKYPVFDAVGMSFVSRRNARFDFPAATLAFCE